MKKAILIEPKLLAEIKQKSPDLYEYYCNSPISQFEFVDYSGSYTPPMYMQQSVWIKLKPVIKHFTIDDIKLMDCLESSWMSGMFDLIFPHADNILDPDWNEIMNWKILQSALAYPSYDFDKLTDSHSFRYIQDNLYNLIVFQESHFFEAWRSIFRQHEEFNKLFLLYQNNQQIVKVDTMEYFNRGE